MEALSAAAGQALARFNDWSQQEISIKNCGRIIGCLDSIKRIGWYASLGPGSRCWGRTQLKGDVTRLKALLGEGCGFEPETIEVGSTDFSHGQSATSENLRFMANPNPSATPSARIYTVNELAALHGLSRNTVIRLYENEPGVQVLQASPEHQRRIGRRYRTLRIPRHVYLRVKNRLENK